MLWRIKALLRWVWEYITLTPGKYDHVVHKLECLLWHATGGMYSKAGYRLEDMYGMVSDYIEECCQEVEQEIKDAEKWIPVTERVPEVIPWNAGTAYSEAVIVWTSGKKAMVAVWDGIDFLCAADYWEAWGERITHWRPLPELPKGE